LLVFKRQVDINIKNRGILWWESGIFYGKRLYIETDDILVGSHPEKAFPDENTPIPAITYGQKPLKKGVSGESSKLNRGVSIRKFEFPDGN